LDYPAFSHLPGPLEVEIHFTERQKLLSVFCTVMRRLTTGILSEKCVVRRFRRCANVI